MTLDILTLSREISAEEFEKAQRVIHDRLEEMVAKASQALPGASLPIKDPMPPVFTPRNSVDEYVRGFKDGAVTGIHATKVMLRLAIQVLDSGDLVKAREILIEQLNMDGPT